MAAILLITVAYIFYDDRDTPDKVAREKRELLQAARSAFGQHKAFPPMDPAHERLPEPLSVRISKTDATITTAGPIDAGSLEYAQAWHEIYYTHHRLDATVHLHVVWKSGSLTQAFPLSEF